MVHAIPSEIQKHIRGPTVKGKKPGLYNVDQKEEINIQPEYNEETRIQEIRRGSVSPGTTLNLPTS